MFYPITHPRINGCLPNFTNLLDKLRPTSAATLGQQHYLQPGDVYYLGVGAYRLRVLVGSVWVPEVGIFAAGQQATLTSGTQGLSIQAFPRQPVVFELQTM